MYSQSNKQTRTSYIVFIFSSSPGHQAGIPHTVDAVTISILNNYRIAIKCCPHLRILLVTDFIILSSM